MDDRGAQDPRRRHRAQHQLDRQFTAFYSKCKDQDPAPRPQLAVPNTTVRWIASTFRQAGGRKLAMVADLVVIAYFFLLRVGEYTGSESARATRTVPLRKRDVTLRRGDTVISNDAPLAELLTADAVTLCLDNQKNGQRNASLHHFTSGDAVLDPVPAAARLVHALRGKHQDTPLGAYTSETGATLSIRARDIIAAVRLGAAGDNLEAAGYDLQRIGSHSLRAGGATNLKLAGYDDDIIKKLGRWSSNTYLHYIQSQMSNLTIGVASRMARSLRFYNIGR